MPSLVDLPIINMFILCDISEKRLYHFNRGLLKRNPVQEPFKPLGPAGVDS